jgi:hypothetical protein
VERGRTKLKHLKPLNRLAVPLSLLYKQPKAFGMSSSEKVSSMADIKPVDSEQQVSETQELNVDSKGDPITADDNKENLAIDAADPNTPARPSKKQVIIERLILCTALFFPLFLATLDTSNPLSELTDVAIVATALPRIFI